MWSSPLLSRSPLRIINLACAATAVSRVFHEVAVHRHAVCCAPPSFLAPPLAADASVHPILTRVAPGDIDSANLETSSIDSTSATTLLGSAGAEASGIHGTPFSCGSCRAAAQRVRHLAPGVHGCARAEGCRPPRAILGKSSRRHDLARRVGVPRVIEPGCHRGVLHEWEWVPAPLTM